MVSGLVVQDQLDERSVYQKRSYDSFELFNKKRIAHAYIMLVVFIILYPLGAISIHLPIDHILKNKVMVLHTPIQIVATILMVAGMALGIRIAHDLNYLEHPVHAHVVIGLLVVCIIIVFQPILGIIQHQQFKKRGDKSIFGLLHRWIGRGAIILGIINSGLGFQLAKTNVIVSNTWYIWSYIVVGVLALIWVGLVVYDKFRTHQPKSVTEGRGRGEMEQDTR